MPAISDSQAAKAVKKSFIILPYDQRGIDVYDRYLRKACEQIGYEPERADEQFTDEILSGIENSLSWAPVVCAYLGSPPAWNINVAIEVGYRLSTRRPLVLLCDEPTIGEELNLPFNISQNRVIQLPRGDVDQETEDKVVANIVRTILQRERERRPFASVQAVANIHFPKSDFSKHSALFIEVSELARSLFGPGIVGKTLAQFYDGLKDDMLSSQYEAFMNEQALLIAQAQNSSETVIARVPIVFRRGPHKGRAFLPMIVNAADYGCIQQLRVLYLDVTSAVRKVTDQDNPELQYYRCLLNPKAKPLSLPDEVHGKRPLIFLAHNSRDKEEYVYPIATLLRQAGAEPWLDKENIPVGVQQVSAISKALDQCDAAFVFLGPEGQGQFQDLEIQTLINLYYEKKKKGKQFRIVPVLLRELKAEAIDDALLRGFNARTYKELTTEIQTIVDGLVSQDGDDEAGDAGMSPRKPR